VPYTRLPALHRLLVERGYYREHPQFLGRSYTSVLTGLVYASA
jgi:hypothetical protein